MTRTIGYTLGLSLVMAVVAHAVVIDFTDTGTYTVGDDLNSYANWEFTKGDGEVFITTDGAGFTNETTDANWNIGRYTGENFTSTAALTTTAEFRFIFSGTDVNKKFFYAGGYMDGQDVSAGLKLSSVGGNDQFAVGVGGNNINDHSANFGMGVLGFSAMGQTSDWLRVTTSIAWQSNDSTTTSVWSVDTTLFNIVSNSAVASHSTTVGVGAAFDGTESAYGAMSVGQYSALGTEELTVRNITVIPEPATLGMLSAVGAGILFIRRRFML